MHSGGDTGNMGGTENTHGVVAGAEGYIDYVFSHLWARGVEELAGLGMTPEQAAAAAHELAANGESYAYLAGDPVCVFGAVDGCTWFQATDAFLEHHVGITKALTEMADKGEYTIYSQCNHPLTEKWFGRMGFVKDGWQGVTVTGTPLYRFRRQHVL